jgi:uncharacterized membrane protein
VALREQGIDMTRKNKKSSVRLRQYIVTGLLVVLPLWITWLILEFLLGLFSSVGGPLVHALALSLSESAPAVSRWLLEPWTKTLAAVGLVLVSLYVLGWTATQVVGKKLLALLDRVIQKIPLIQTIYGGARKLLSALQQQSDKVQRVVLIDFPSPEMKAVGLVTRTFTEQNTGEELAAVYVPTTPNPTSGYLEIVPLASVISTNWTMDEAMTFIISGGAVGPDRLEYFKRQSR